jgi:hypothetical protein
MNCANHPGAAAVAYCRTCGKPLCPTCARDVRGVIYCENCLAERLQGVQPVAPPPTAYASPPPAGFPAPPAGYVVPPSPGYAAPQPLPGYPRQSSGPNPTVAGILAGFFPFGVGAAYEGQYAKGLAHLLIFFGLIFAVSHSSENIAPFFGLSIAFFYVYQIIDAVRTAHALQAGQPAPDPLGLGQAFGAGEKVDTSTIPTTGIVLIGIGVIFLLQTMGVFSFSVDRFWPLLLIALGVWLLGRRLGWFGSVPVPRYDFRRHRAMGFMGPVMLITIGVLSLSENVGGPSWDRTWPVLLLAGGLTQLMTRRAVPPTPPMPPVGSGPNLQSPTMQSPTDDVPPPPSEVSHG